MEAEPRTLRVLELFSGVGGMHFALQRAAADAEVVAAVDINGVANAIYAHNFARTKILNNNIEAMSAAALDSIAADVWTMSPPCQPFTAKGLQRGADDRRCDALKAILERLEALARPPRLVLMENVAAFGDSPMRGSVLEALARCGYKVQEFVLCPTQFGIPNTRRRYYLAAVRADTFPALNLSYANDVEEVSPKYVCADEEDKSFFLDEKTLDRFKQSIDVICPSSTRSACFTKSYGRYVTGCGSYFIADASQISGNRLKLAETSGLRVRRLTVREVANLMCFPASFTWPTSSTDRQLYHCLGNSINVCVVANLLKALLCPTSPVR